MIQESIRTNVLLAGYTTLRAGGPAEQLVECRSADELILAYQFALDRGLAVTLIGYGSNLLASDQGVKGLVIVNRATRISVARSGEVVAETGAWLQDVFLKSAQAGLSGLSFAVGIPGSIGGALVSNAGAYRSCIGDLVRDVEIVGAEGVRWAPKEWMQFSYRDSVFRRVFLEPALSRRR